MRNYTLIKATLAFFIIINCIFTPTAFSQDPPFPRTITELTQQLDSEMKRQHVAGMMLTLVTKDSVLYEGGLGFANLEKKIPVNETHTFRGASITKLFVSLGILNLLKEGKLTVDTKLKDIAPEVPFKNKWEATNPITIAELMEHTTGFSDKSPFEEYNFSDKQLPGIESLKVFQKFMAAKWKPGENHSYSGVNYAILGYIIERISGKPINDYLREKVFRPLGMPGANVKLIKNDSDSYAEGYVWKKDHFQQVPYAPQFNAAYGSLNASAVDYSHALLAFLNDGQTPAGQFLSKDMLEDAETPHSYLSAKAGFKNTYAYGNECREINGYLFRGHMGAIGSYLSAFLYNRKFGVAFAFSMNTNNENLAFYAQDLITRYLTQHTPKPVAAATYPINATAIAPWLGYYRWSNPNQLYSGFFDGLRNTFRLEQKGQVLEVNIISRGSLKWQAADSNGVLYKYENAVNPQIMFLKDYDNNPSITDGSLYFKKISVLQAWVPIILFAGSTFILLSSLVFGFINLILFIFKKEVRYQWPIRMSPVFATIGLLLALNTATHLLEHMKEVLPMNISFLWWKTGLYIFAIFTLYTPCLLVFRWKKIKSNWLKFYLSLTVLSACYLFAVLAVNHWY